MEVEIGNEGAGGTSVAKVPDNEEGANLRELVVTAFLAMGSGSNFNRILRGVNVLSASPSSLLVELTLTNDHVNDKGTMHGGFSAAMVDVLTATSVRLKAVLRDCPIVSIDLSVTYILPVYEGESVLMEAKCLRAGHSIAFTEATFRRKRDDEIVVRASQRLAILHYRHIPTKEPKPKIEKQSTGAVNGNNIDDRGPGGSLMSRMNRSFAQLDQSTNFSSIGRNLKLLKVDPPTLAVELKLAPEHLNEGGTMHGGFTASLVDLVTARAVGMTETKCPMVSLDISISYLLPASIGEEIIVEAKCLKIGRMMAFTEISFIRKRDGALLTKGKHNIYLLRKIEEEGKGEQRSQF